MLDTAGHILTNDHVVSAAAGSGRSSVTVTFPDGVAVPAVGETVRVAPNHVCTAVNLADEATGNLDTRTSFEVLVLFQRLHSEGRTIIFVTHNPEIVNYSTRTITLRDGRVTSDVLNGHILDAAEALAKLPVENDR